MYATSIYCRRNAVVPLVGSVAQSWTGNVVPIEIGLNTSSGDGVAILRYSRKTVNFDDGAAAQLLLKPEEKPRKMLLAYRFDDTFARCEAATGGKGASLALLTAAIEQSKSFEYKVPPGFVVTVAAYEMQMNRNRHLVELIGEIRARAYELSAKGSVEDACQRAIEVIEATALEPEIVEAVTEHFSALTGSGDARFAVRSSAIGEDGEDASSAGQNETFLGLHGVTEVLAAIRKCWASLYTYRSVEYRRQHVQPISTEMAVVVQRMVHAECAGVMFTKHPANGDPSKVLITANYGLGEVN